MNVLGIQNIYFTFSDVNRAKAFYQGLFPLSMKFEDKEKWVQFEFQGQNIALASHGEAGGHKNAVVVFEVDGAEHLQQRISELGGELTETRDMGSHGTVYTVLDPEGNMFQLFARASLQTRPQTDSTTGSHDES